MLPRFARQKKAIFFILTLAAAVVLLYPSTQYQTMLSQGDHGRDLYAFQKTLEGQTPYKDYWWVYGPLMPYYYGLCFKFFGLTISSILLGKAFLNLLGALLFYLILSLLTSPTLACLGSLWFLTFNPDFYFTFNHVGGITTMLGLFYCLFLYLKTPKPEYLYTGIFLSLILSLIKINFGVVNFASFFIAVLFIDFVKKEPLFYNRKLFFLFSLFVLPLSIFTIYFNLLYKLPLYEIRQCLPYLSADHPFHIPVSQAINILIQSTVYNIQNGWPNSAFAALIILSLAHTLSLLKTKRKGPEADVLRAVFCALLISVIFYIINLHEFLVSGVTYRWFWAKPFGLLCIFMLIAVATRKLTRMIKFILYAAIFLIILLEGANQYHVLKLVRNPAQYISLPRAQTFVGNHPLWINTVVATTQFLEKNLKRNETFLALPYDVLHYYLSGKTSPSRQLIFFDHINIPADQEKKVIADLENKKVDWVVLSNRIKSREEGLGEFGKTYCSLLGDYLNTNFKVVAQFGDWVSEPGWAWNYGTKILQRKNSLYKQGD